MHHLLETGNKPNPNIATSFIGWKRIKANLWNFILSIFATIVAAYDTTSSVTHCAKELMGSQKFSITEPARKCRFTCAEHVFTENLTSKHPLNTESYVGGR